MSIVCEACTSERKCRQHYPHEPTQVHDFAQRQWRETVELPEHLCPSRGAGQTPLEFRDLLDLPTGVSALGLPCGCGAAPGPWAYCWASAGALQYHQGQFTSQVALLRESDLPGCPQASSPCLIYSRNNMHTQQSWSLYYADQVTH